MSENAPPEESPLEKENHTLKQKIDDLERALSEIEVTKSQASNHRLVSSPWWAKAIFIATVLISAIPSYFVIQDRWLGKIISIHAVDEFWWNTAILKGLGYPRYFLIIFGVVIYTALVVYFWRSGPRLIFSNLGLGETGTAANQVDPGQYRISRYLLIGAFLITDVSVGFVLIKGRIPGWELLLTLALYISGWLLREYPVNEFQRHFRERGRFYLDAGIFVIAICGTLYALFGESKPNFIFFGLLVIASINFLRHRKETPTIFWISIISLVALTWKIDSWEYVVIGDEYSFYSEIRNILENRSVWELINNTFNGNLVYGTHPYFSSYIQDFFMKLFDNHNFGWRFSNPFLVAASLFFFYYFFKAFVPRRTALLTVALLGASHYLLSFSKIGYNNLQALFALGLVLAATLWALRSMRFIAFAVLGLSIGLCFYVYPAALYIVPLPILGLLIYLPPVNKDALKRWGWMIVSAALLIYPLIPQPKYWTTKVAGTFLINATVSSSAGTLIHNIALNILYTSLSFLYIPEQSHYVSTGYMDPVSSIFIMMGFAVLAKLALGRNKSAFFLASSFLWMFFIVGATHGRNFPTATRMFLLLPWFALFTAFGLEWCAERSELLFNENRRDVLNLAIGLIVLVNLYQAYVIDIRNTAQYQSLPSLFIKTVREIDADPAVPPKSYAFVAPPGWDTSGIAAIQRVYLVPDSPRQLINLPVEGNQLPESAAELVSQRDVVVIVKADIDSAVTAQVDAQLQGWGKFMCEIRNQKGVLQFQLWHSGDLLWLCQ